MLISPPFLLPTSPDDASLLETGLKQPASREATTGAPEGNFPLSQKLMWHTGIHLSAPNAPRSEKLPVSAIADGSIIFIQNPRIFAPGDGPEKDDGQTYNPFGDSPSWCDNGMFIIEHTTEIGARDSNPTKITFYSYYYHLSTIHRYWKVGKQIYRKDPIGKSGKIYGNDGQIEIGISCDRANLHKIIGRNPDWIDPQQVPTKDGRTDSVFGDIYIYLPATTPISSSVPTSHLRSASASAGHTLGAAQWVQVHAKGGEFQITSYTTAGQPGHTTSEKDGEYNLYKSATDRHNSAIKTDAHAKSSPSGWYELLRFGRNLGRSDTDKDLLPNNAAHWRKIKTIDDNEVWADLNATGTYKFSDADFLPAFGWNCFGDDSTPNDQRCDSIRLKACIRDPKDPDSIKDNKKLALRIGEKEVMQKLKRAICQFPFEWDKESMVTRYGFMQQQPDVTATEWMALKKHMEAMAVAQLPTVFKQAQWHFHPGEFIGHFRKCGWLSKEEIRQLVPQQALRTVYEKKLHRHEILWEKIDDFSVNEDKNPIFKNHLIPLNITLRKYGISTPMRQACFFGNAIQETTWLQSLAEFGGNSLWYAPWYGRGFLQLTNPENYCSYWAWRGRIIAPALRDAMANAYKQIEAELPANRSNKTLQDGNFSELNEEIKRWRTEVQAGVIPPNNENVFAPSDSAGFYWIKAGMAKYADQEHVLEAHDVETNHGSKTYYRSLAFWQASAKVNLPSAVGRTNYSGLNGFDSRCCAYGIAIAILAERLLPDEKGQTKLMFPKDFVPRR